MTEITCPLCGNRMYKRTGVYGSFFGCEKYPQCRGTRPTDFQPEEDDMGETLNERNARLEKDLLDD